MHKSELLMPAGSLTKMKTAILYGADALYAGTPSFCLRTKSDFGIEELMEWIRIAHQNGVRVYLTLNIYSHNNDIDKLPEFVTALRQTKPDGIIIADPGVFQYIKEQDLGIPLHISTQANVCSSLTVDYWKKQGAELVVLAREVPFADFVQIRKDHPDIRLEAFMHGAMCMAHSGRCLLSNFMSDRGANQGNCAQSCRWNYKVHIRLKDGSIEELEINENNQDLVQFFLEEEFRPGEYMEITEDKMGTYIMNAKDLCLMPVLWEYLEAQMDSLKIEGRNKTQYYAAITARCYRHAIDEWYKLKEQGKEDQFNPGKYMNELHTLQSRGYTMGFHGGMLTPLAHNYDNAKSVAHFEFAGWIRGWDGDDIIFELKNQLKPRDAIEFVSPYQWQPIRIRLDQYTDSVTGDITEKVSAGQKKAIRIPASAFALYTPEDIKKLLPSYTVARKECPVSAEDKARLLLDIESQKLEIKEYNTSRDVACNVSTNNDDISPDYQKYLDLKKQVGDMQPKKLGPGEKKKAPKMDDCCGKGCNGCRIFQYDPKYEKAREELKKQDGNRLKERAVE